MNKNNKNKNMLCTKHIIGFPWFVTGIVEADGCFSISFEKSKSALSGFRIKPVFTITQHRDNKNILEEIQKYFEKGRIVEHNDICSYELRSVVDIKNILIGHFNKYPLKGIKKVNYKLFEKIIMLLFDKKHLSNSKLYNKLIIYLVWSMNTKGLNRSFSLNELLELVEAITHENKIQPSELELELELELDGVMYNPEKYSENFINKIETNYKSEIENTSVNTDIDPNYVTGLIDGDGSFYFSHRLRNKRLNIVPSFTLGQHKDSYILLKLMQNYFNCGTINKVNENYYRFTVSKLSDICNIVINHFENNPIIGVEKLKIFNIYKEGCLILKSGVKNKKVSLSQETISKLKTLTINMNKKGKYRINK